MTSMIRQPGGLGATGGEPFRRGERLLFLQSVAQATAPVGFQNHFIHIRHSGRIYDGYDPDRANPYARRFGPRLLQNYLQLSRL